MILTRQRCNIVEGEHFDGGKGDVHFLGFQQIDEYIQNDAMIRRMNDC